MGALKKKTQKKEIAKEVSRGLRVAPNAPLAPGWRGGFQLVAAVFALAIGHAVFSTLSRPSLETDVKQLSEIYRRDGMAAFQENKRRLGERIAAEAAKPTAMDATTRAIAVYLFPETLPNDDFEKREALETWATWQRQIEQVPNTQDSRNKFEQMEWTIWNYESAKRNAPQVTAVAGDILSIYEALSRP